VVELWQSKKTIVEIASALGLKSTPQALGFAGRDCCLASSWFLIARQVRFIGMNRRDSALDKIRAAGNVVRVAVRDRDTPEPHQAARTRGGRSKARLDHQQKYWEVSAVEAAPLLAVCRRKPS